MGFDAGCNNSITRFASSVIVQRLVIDHRRYAKTSLPDRQSPRQDLVRRKEGILIAAPSHIARRHDNSRDPGLITRGHRAGLGRSTASG